VALANWANGIANVLQKQEQYAKALELYDNALALYGKWLGPESSRVAATKFNIAGAAESAEAWEQAEKNYRESIALAVKAWPDTNENVEMFRTALGLFLNKRHRFDEAEPWFKTALSRVDRNPKFREDDVFKAAQLGLAIAQYATAPTKEHRDEFERLSNLPADAGDDVKEIARQQVDAAKSLGLPVAALEQRLGKPQKTQ